ncbi:MAG TPA: PrsW family intramembrane metalloprotease [Longimicrobium sp.]|jgi:RsiW-degrading membrane proteinase PrsW (M82 family)
MFSGPNPFPPAGPGPDFSAAPWPPAPLPPVRHPHPMLTRGAVVCGILSLLIIGSDMGPGAFFMGVALAVIPVPLYVVLALWLDRFEPEPARTLAQTFAWGATVAVFISLVVNISSDAVARGLLGPDLAGFFGAVFSAPLVEEMAKGLALLALFRELKDEFDGVVDGVVYAAMVGLGFAMIENVEYYGAAVEEGVQSGVLTFAVRGMMGPFAHPLFTSMFGIGLGYAREGHGRGSQVWAPLLGFAAAVVMHAVWNLSASFDDGVFFGLYTFVMVPTFVGVLVLIVVSLRREGRIIREHLEHLVDDGLIAPEELECLCRVRRRLRASYLAWRLGGVARWRRRREMHRVASELAFHRWRVRRGLTLGPEADARREAEYLAQLRQLCD